MARIGWCRDRLIGRCDRSPRFGAGARPGSRQNRRGLAIPLIRQSLAREATAVGVCAAGAVSWVPGLASQPPAGRIRVPLSSSPNSVDRRRFRQDSGAEGANAASYLNKLN